MQTRALSIFRAYEIKCKLFAPDDLEVKHVIVGVHGFAGDKESSMLERLATDCSPNGVALLCFDFPAMVKALSMRKC